MAASLTLAATGAWAELQSASLALRVPEHPRAPAGDGRLTPCHGAKAERKDREHWHAPGTHWQAAIEAACMRRFSLWKNGRISKHAGGTAVSGSAK